MRFFQGLGAISREEILKDRKDQVDLLISSDCPLEVVDLHVFVDPKDAKLRDIHFLIGALGTRRGEVGALR